MPSIETFLVELHHRSFDHLDGETILFSIRPVPRFCQSVVRTYNRCFRFQFRFQTECHVLCQLIHPENITALILSNEKSSKQIDLFISLVCLGQLTRLHSLILLQIDESQFSFILERINLNLLISLSFNIKEYDDSALESTNKLLSSVITQPTFQKLQFNIITERMSKILWPMNCTVHYLTIDNRIYINDLITILQCSLHLQALIIRNIPFVMFQNVTSACFWWLTSLTINELSAPIYELELFLLITPSLVYLKLIGGERMMDGRRWEHFIEKHLPYLNKFEFYFYKMQEMELSVKSLEWFIASFQTPF